MSVIKLDAEQFRRKSKRIRAHLPRPLVVMLGKSQDVPEFGINSALFLYLLNYEFPETVLIVDDVCTAITSQRKGEILGQIEGLRVVVRNKDNSNIQEAYDALGEGPYCVVDRENIRGDLCQRILKRVRTEDATDSVSRLFLVKGEDEIEHCRASAKATSFFLRKGVEMLWDGVFSKKKLEEVMNESIEGVDMNLLEFSFPIESTRDTLRVGLRYRGYCAEASRTIVKDMSEVYMVQDHILGLVRPGVDSKSVYSEAEKFLSANNLSFKAGFIYTVGLMNKERGFEDSFVLQKGNVFVINLTNEDVSLSNTFVLDDSPEYLTSRDTALDFVEARPRFRNKTKEYEMNMRRREHQKELLDKLIEERLEHYRNVEEENGQKEKKEGKMAVYAREGLVPRQGKVVVDFSREAVAVPVGSYIVPFHVSSIKSVSVVDEAVLKINFKVEGKGGSPVEVGDGEEERPSRKGTLSFIKSISIRGSDARELFEEINNLKKTYSTKTDRELVESLEELEVKAKPFALTDVYMKTDIKTGSRKRRVGNLELHKNGFRFSEDNTSILFSNIRHIFFSEGSTETNTVLHFHLVNPVILGRKTKNIQFYQEVGTNTTYDTMKRGDEHMEYIVEKEEEDRRRSINSQFRSFVEKIESETSFKVQEPRDGFYGVPFRESVMIRQTHECLVSIDEPPYFVLTLEDVEIVNFERVVFSVKTSDMVFIMKDKTHPPMSILSVDAQKINKFKEYLDSNNILFMETSVNIQWNNLIKTILKDPVSFYENGAWSELMIEDSGEASEEDSEVSEESTISESESVATDDDVVSDVSSEEASSEDESYDESEEELEDEEYEDSSEEDYDIEPKKRRQH